MAFMRPAVKAFLKIVQPNELPTDLVVKVFEKGKGALSNENTMRELLWYEMGFLLCTGLGVLYMLLMPLFAAVAVRHRAKNKLTSGTKFKKRVLWVVTLTILLWNIYMFMSNAAFKVDVDQINGTLNDLHAYFSAVPEQFDHMMNESSKVVDEIRTIGPKLGGEIQNSLSRGVIEVLHPVGIMKNLSNDFNTDLTSILLKLTTLESSKGHMEFKKAINDAIHAINGAENNNECGNVDQCKTMLKNKTKKLTEDILEIFDFGYFSQSLLNLQPVLKAVNWDSVLREGNDYLNNITWIVTRDTRAIVQNMEDNLEDTKTQISQTTSDLLTSVSTNVTDTLQQLQRNVSMITPVVERAEHITRAVGVVLCCMVLLVVVCNVLGLLLGPLGLEPKADPTVRSSTAHYGGTALLFSAGFIFLFSWLLMGVVLLLFVPGGNMYALVCKPWNNGELLKIIDTTRLMELGPMLGLNRNLTLTDVYTDCQKNRSLWSTLRMNEMINLEEQLNVSQYTDAILDNVTIPPIMLLTVLSHVEKGIITLLNETQNINFNRFTQQIYKSGSLHQILSDMIVDIDEYKNDKTRELAEAHEQLTVARNRFLLRIEDKIHELNSTTENLRSNLHEFNGTVRKVFSKVGEAQDFLNNYSTTQSIKIENRDFVNRRLSNITVTFVEWANLTQQVVRCGPVARAVDMVKDIICEDMVESLNTFWFSLALCLIFFIPSSIFSIKLAKYYRRMEETDVLQENGRSE